MKINKNLVSSSNLKQKPIDALTIPFGTVFTDHMFSMKHCGGHLNEANILPFGNLSLSPAALCLYYGQGIF